MDPSPSTQLAVEPAGASTVVVHVAGELSAAGGAQLAALLDRRMQRPGGRAVGARRVVVDLGPVRSFDTDGVELLRRAGLRLDAAGVSLLLSGLDGRRELLPRRVDDALDGFASVSRVDDAG